MPPALRGVITLAASARAKPYSNDIPFAPVQYTETGARESDIMIKSLFLVSLLFALSALAVAAENDTITIEHAWAPESPPMVSNGAAYMTIIASGGETDRWIGASGDVAEAIELHTHLLEDNIMKMRPIEAIEINPDEPTVLRPGGPHIMLIKLNQPLVAGQRFPLTLHFAKAGDVTVEVTVRKAAGTGMPPKGHQGHGDIRH